jgi:hypothetical protein
VGTLQFELSAPLVLIPAFPQILEEVVPPTQGVELVLGLNRGVWKEEGPDGVASPCNRFPESVCRLVCLCFGNGATASPFWLWKKLPCDLKGVPVPKSGMSCLLVRAGGRMTRVARSSRLVVRTLHLVLVRLAFLTN